MERSLLFALSEGKLRLRTAIGARVAWTAIGMYDQLSATDGTISVLISTDHGTLLSGLLEQRQMVVEDCRMLTNQEPDIYRF